MAGAPSQHRTGIVLIVAAAVAWSTAPLFTRLLAFDSWTILFWRGLFGGGVIAAILVLETPLMPLWVWLAFQEVPGVRTLAGGALVMTAVIADIIGDIRAPRQIADPPR
jgi:drug/metabolite transporter (DMT)-like permease